MLDPNVGRADPSPGGDLEELDWSEIQAPGAYLHVSSGMLMRVFDEQPAPPPPDDSGSATRMARLAKDPHAPLSTLRAIALWHGYLVQF